MKPRDRVHAALKREPVDRVLVFMWFHPDTAVILSQTLDIPINRVAEVMGDDIRQTWVGNNHAMEGITHELSQRDVGLLLLHPGHVRTRMGGTGTDLLPQQSVAAMRILVDQFSMKNTGRFFRYDGVEMPW